jgi:hypothetical protein
VLCNTEGLFLLWAFKEARTLITSTVGNSEVSFPVRISFHVNNISAKEQISGKTFHVREATAIVILFFQKKLLMTFDCFQKHACENLLRFLSPIKWCIRVI